jgi:hypothetical protein
VRTTLETPVNASVSSKVREWITLCQRLCVIHFRDESDEEWKGYSLPTPLRMKLN